MKQVRYHFVGMAGSPYRNASHLFFVVGGCYVGMVYFNKSGFVFHLSFIRCRI
jgi:hypothetical protein